MFVSNFYSTKRAIILLEELMKSGANPKKEEAKMEEEMPKDDGKNETGGDGEQKKEGEQGKQGSKVLG